MVEYLQDMSPRRPDPLASRPAAVGRLTKEDDSEPAHDAVTKVSAIQLFCVCVCARARACACVRACAPLLSGSGYRRNNKTGR